MNTHQYSATHFERDLTKGAAENNAGVHIMHGMTGIPGKLIAYDSVVKVLLIAMCRRILQLRDLPHTHHPPRDTPVLRALPHIVSTQIYLHLPRLLTTLAALAEHVLSLEEY